MNGRLYDPLLRRFLNADEIELARFADSFENIKKRGKTYKTLITPKTTTSMGM